MIIMNLIFKGSDDTLINMYIAPQIDNVQILKSKEAADQIEALIYNWSWNISKNTAIIDEFLVSEYFTNENGQSEYPINISNTEIKTFADVGPTPD